MSNLGGVYVFQNIYHNVIEGLGLGPVHLVRWTSSDGDTCLKVDTCHNLNEFSTTRYWT